MSIDPIQIQNNQQIQQPQTNQAPIPKIIPPEDLGDVYHMGRSDTPDDFMARKILALTGQPFNDKFAAKEGFRISCGFQPKGQNQEHRDMYTFVQNGQEHFGVKRYVTVEWKENGVDQKACIAFNIELELKVPQEKDYKSKKAFSDAMDQGMYMAGIAGKMAAEPWELMVKDKVGQAKGDLKWGELKNHINKIKQDRFVTLELISNAKSIKLDSSDTFKTRRISEVKLHVRGGRSELARNGGDLHDPRLHLSTFQADTYRVNDQKGRIWDNKFDRKKNWHLAPTPLYTDQKEVSSSVRHYAEAQKLNEIRNEITDEDKSLKQVLEEKDLKPEMLQGAIKSQQERLQGDFNNYLYMLSDRDGLQNLVDEFGDKPAPNFTNNEYIESNFHTVTKPDPETKLQKLKEKISPQKKETPIIGSNLEKLHDLRVQGGLSEKEVKDLKAIAACSQRAINKMEEIHAEMVENEKLLKQLDTSKSNKKTLDQKQIKRESVLDDCQALLGKKVNDSIELDESSDLEVEETSQENTIKGGLPQRELLESLEESDDDDILH